MGSKRGGRGGARSEAKGAQRESIDLFQATAEELRVDLKLRAEQESLWEAYVNKIDALKRDIVRQRLRARSAEAPGDAPHALDRLADTQRDRLTAMEDIADAGRALYKTLDQEQKAIADTRLAPLVSAATGEAESRPPKPRP